MAALLPNWLVSSVVEIKFARAQSLSQVRQLELCRLGTVATGFGSAVLPRRHYARPCASLATSLFRLQKACLSVGVPRKGKMDIPSDWLLTDEPHCRASLMPSFPVSSLVFACRWARQLVRVCSTFHTHYAVCVHDAECTVATGAGELLILADLLAGKAASPLTLSISALVIVLVPFTRGDQQKIKLRSVPEMFGQMFACVRGFSLSTLQARTAVERDCTELTHWLSLPLRTLFRLICMHNATRRGLDSNSSDT